MPAISTDHVSVDAIPAIIGAAYPARLDAQVSALQDFSVTPLISYPKRCDNPEADGRYCENGSIGSHGIVRCPLPESGQGIHHRTSHARAGARVRFAPRSSLASVNRARLSWRV